MKLVIIMGITLEDFKLWIYKEKNIVYPKINQVRAQAVMPFVFH
jgi:hypothetical protein